MIDLQHMVEEKEEKMKIKDKLDALVEERIDYVKELVIRDRYDELYEVISINFGFDKLSEEEIKESKKKNTKKG